MHDRTPPITKQCLTLEHILLIIIAIFFKKNHFIKILILIQQVKLLIKNKKKV